MITDRIFVARVLLSFFTAGGWIAFSTILAERFGSKTGGLVSNLPSNILVSLIFISIVNDVDYVADLAPAVPIGLTINTVFMVAFILMLRIGLIFSVTVSLSIWFLIALLFARLEMTNIVTNILLCLITISLSVWFLEKFIRIKSQKNNVRNFSPGQIIFRILFSGAIVATIVVISRYSSPYFTGIFSTFPAMLLSTLVLLTISQGKEFAMATGKILILSLTNIIVYVVAVSFTYPWIGIFFGTIVSYSVAALWITFLYPVVRRME